MRRFLMWLLVVIILVALAVVVLRQIFPVPSTAGRPIDNSPGLAADSRLGAGFADLSADHPGRSGVMSLLTGASALATRLFLIENADATIDAQYYIWYDDTSGRMMLKALLAAADRGVKVRLLLDDNGIPNMDPILASLGAHPNVAVRLFNPSTIRSPKLFGYTFDFFRMNRRMHNKALIVDGAAAVIGGRNVGDVYFEVGAENFYVDLDVLVIGKAVPDTATEFDLYWNSKSAIDAGLVLTASPGDIATQLAPPDDHVSSVAETRALADHAIFLDKLRTEGPQFEWADVSVVYDDPAKGLGMAARDGLLVARISEVTGGVSQHFELASAYFVPGRDGTRFLADLAQRGVKVKVLTNSANANDVWIVHTGYLKYRRELLEAGVELYELKRFEGQRTRDLNISDFTGSSSVSLHAKTFSIDAKRIFVGSFNFDPRSIFLNCEMGVVIESSKLAADMAKSFDDTVVRSSYRPQLRDGTLIWLESQPGQPDKVYDTEPHTTAWSRFVLRAVGYLPIEWLL